MLLVLAGCESNAPTQEEKAQKPASDQTKQFITLVMSADSKGIEKALEQTAAGSAARRFAEHKLSVANSISASDFAEADYSSEVTKVSKGYNVCRLDDDGKAHCSLWANVQKVGTKFGGFTVDGEPVNSFVSVDGKSHDVPLLGTVSELSAIQPPGEDFVEVAFLVQAKDKDLGGYFDYSTFVDEAGRQWKTTVQQMPSTLVAGAKANVSLIFPNATLPGKAHIDLTSDDENQTSSTVVADLAVAR